MEWSTMYAACTGAMSTKADCMLCLCSLLMLICSISPRNRALSNRWRLLTAGQQSVHPTGTPHTYSKLIVLIHKLCKCPADRSELCLRVLVLAYWSGTEYISALFAKCFLGKLITAVQPVSSFAVVSTGDESKEREMETRGGSDLRVPAVDKALQREVWGGERDGARLRQPQRWFILDSEQSSLSQTRQSVFSGESNAAAVWEYIITALLFWEDGAVLLKRRVFWVSDEGRW